MTVDDVEGFLKFLDNASFQLACLLDIDGQGAAKKSFTRQKISLTSKARTTRPRAANSAASKRNQQTKLPQQQTTKTTTTTTTTRGKGGRRRSSKLVDLIDSQAIEQTTQNVEPDDRQQLGSNGNQQQHQDLSKLTHHHQQHTTTTSSDTHTLDGRLTLIADDLPLDQVASISPATHLSPMDPSIQFNTSIHQQHYHYPLQRGHIDSYHLHDEFTGHDSIPISNSSSHINQEQQRGVNHQHLMNHHHQQSALRAETLDGSTLNSAADCYPQLHIHHQHHHHHQPQYHQLDQQWLGAATTDGGLQMGASDSGALDHVVPLSPATHQSLDQVQFSTPLYHHSYYNTQTEQLDSFQHMSDEYTTSAGPLTASSSSPIGHLHRMQQDQHASGQQHHQHPAQAQIRMSSLDVSNGSSNNNYDQQQQQHHQQHHHQQNHHSQVHSQTEHQIHNTTYNGHHNQHHHHQQQHHHHHQQQHQHHHHHQMMPLMNGLEPSGVIIQDINLASASWNSPEDLYSI